MNEDVLEIEYKVDYKEFRRIWFDYFKKSLPTMLAFWGVAFLGSLLVLYFYEDKFFGALITFVFFSVPFSLTLVSYQNFMKAAKQNFSTLSEEEKIVHLSFQRNSDGFDSRNGKNFSHIAWESIKGVTELEDFFVFARAGNVRRCALPLYPDYLGRHFRMGVFPDDAGRHHMGGAGADYRVWPLFPVARI